MDGHKNACISGGFAQAGGARAFKLLLTSRVVYYEKTQKSTVFSL